MGFLRKILGGRSIEVAKVEPGRTEPPPPVYAVRRPYDVVVKAQEAAAVGNTRKAERWFLKGVELYRIEGDQMGVGFALGRLGSFYQEQNRMAEAIQAYESAVSMASDIPSVYSGLMAVYADGDNEDEMFRTAEAFAKNVPKRNASIPQLLISYAKNRLKDGDVTTAERWLLRTEEWATRHGLAEDRFVAWGQRGYAVERSGDLDRALEIYEDAVQAGSTDRVTYTRLLIAYERAKRWADVLTLAQRAIGIQRDAAWEQDLRKRIDRAQAKSCPTSKRSKTETIPAFSMRHGEQRISLCSQTSIKRGASRLANSPDGRALLVSAGSSKPDNLTLLDAFSHEVVWTKSVPGASAEVLALEVNLFLVASDVGRIGDGYSELLWLKHDGTEVTKVRLPDKLSEIRAANGVIAAGCRDGYLYLFDTKGRERGRFRVPARQDLPADQPAFKPCPYFVQLSGDGQRVVFSSWDTVFAVDARGRLQWTWRITSEPKTFSYTYPIPDGVASSHHYKVLGVSPSATDDQVRKAFRQRALDTHPDRHPNEPEASEKFREAVQAYEAILSGAAAGTGSGSFTVQINMPGFMTTIYGLAVSHDGGEYVIAASDGSLTYLDKRGRPTKRLVAKEGAGYLVSTSDLSRIAYAHWQGFNFYSPQGLLSTYPSEKLYQMRMSPDGLLMVAWDKKEFHIFTADGQPAAELEFARNVSDVAFTSPREVTVAAGKVIALAIH